MVEYYQNEFLFIIASFEKRIVVFSENGSWIKSSRLIKRKKPLVLVTNNKSIFNTNNNKKKDIKKI